MITLWVSYSDVVSEGESSYTTPDNDIVVQHFIRWNSVEGDTSGFP